MLTSVSLCSGYAGLDLAVEDALGASTVAFCENDAAPSLVLAHHYPDRPNCHDVKALDWARILADLTSAGYPCQPFSHAGQQRGTEDPRHLWPAISAGLAVQRPRLVVLENVRNHLNLGWDVVLADLDQLGYDVRWTLLRAADVGAPHNRARMFALAVRRDGAATFPTFDFHPLARCAEGTVWAEDGLFGAIQWDGPLPAAGTMVGGNIWAERPLTSVGVARLLGTPRARNRAASQSAVARGELKGRLEAQVALLGTPQARDWKGSPAAGFNEGSLWSSLALLPTPAVNDMGRGKSVEAWDEWRAKMQAKHGNGNGHGPSLEVEALRLLPTPLAHDTATPKTEDAVEAMRARGHGVSNLNETVAHQVDWGLYGPAVVRWEELTRPAPPPTVPSGSGRPTLSPLFVEWMMGLPEGHVTAVPGLTRDAQVKMLGNGVVPQQAHCALEHLAAPLAWLQVSA